MVCNSCQKQPSCLPAQLARGDATLAEMLDHLKSCKVQTPKPRLSWLAWVYRGWHALRQTLRRWLQRWGFTAAPDSL